MSDASPGITLWGVTTLAPILIIAGALVALLLAGVVDQRWSKIVIVAAVG